REVAVPFVLSGSTRHRQEPRPTSTLWGPSNCLPADVPVHVGVDQILRWNTPSLERLQKLSPVRRPVERQRSDITRGTWFHSNPSERISPVQSRILVNHGTVAGESKLQVNRLATFDLQLLALYAHLLPRALVAIHRGIGLRGLLDIEVLLVDTHDREAEAYSLVVSG